MSFSYAGILRKAEGYFTELSFARYAAVLSFILISGAVIRASTLGLAYDEAYTYIKYADPGNFLTGTQRLNNHWLNTILIYILHWLSGVRYNDFLIRLPNLIFYAFYCYGAYLFSSKLRFNYLIFSLFVFNYYLFQYFSNGRGYGIGAACILLSCYFINLFQNTMKKEYFNYFILFSCLAVLAQGLCIYISTALLIVIVVKLHTLPLKDYVIPICIYFLVCLCVGCFIIYVSRAGYPLYSGGYSKFFLGIGDSILPISFFSYIFSICVLLLFSYSIFIGKRELFIYACGLYVCFALLAHLILGKGFPAGRELLPLYPLVICAIAEALQSFNFSKRISSGIIIFFIILFSFQGISWKDTPDREREFRSDKEKIQSFLLNKIPLEDKEFREYLKELNHFTGYYYVSKYRYLKKK